MGQLQEIHGELRKLGYQIVALSPDRPERVRELQATKGFDYVLLSDSDLEAAAAFGVAYEVDAATLEAYRGFGIDLEAASGKTHHRLPVPSVFLADRDGRIRFSYADPDYRRRIPPGLLLAAARALAED